MTTTQELLKSSFELNLNNYGPEDVERLNDWAIKAYAALEALEAEVKHLNLHLKATQSGRDAAAGASPVEPSQALELSDDEIDALLPTITLKGLDPKQQVWLTEKDAIAFARAIIAAIKQGGQHD